MFAGNVPSQRDGREESPTVAGSKTGRTVVTSVQLNQITSVIIIIDTSEETAGSPTVTGIDDSLVAGSHTDIRIAGRIQAGNGVLHQTELIIFFLKTSHYCKVVLFSQAEKVICVQIDRLITCTVIAAGKFTVGRHT